MSAISGQKTVTTAGTAEALGTLQVNSALMVKALDTNTGAVYLGNDGTGDVASDSGLVLAAGDAVIFEYVGNLGSLMLDSAADGEGVAWLALNV